MNDNEIEKIFDHIKTRIFYHKYDNEKKLSFSMPINDNIVFLTILDRKNRYSNVLGCMGNYGDDIGDAIYKALNNIVKLDSRFSPYNESKVSLDDLTFEITNIFLSEKKSLNEDEWKRQISNNRGRLAMLFESGNKRAFYIPSMSLEMNIDELYNSLKKKAGIYDEKFHKYVIKSDDYVDEYYKNTENIYLKNKILSGGDVKNIAKNRQPKFHSWYIDEEKLEDKLKRLAIQAESKSDMIESNNINGIIVPHAGYKYSGDIAADGYRYLHKIKNKINRIFILAPSHRQISHVILPSFSTYVNPIQDIKVDIKVINELRELSYTRYDEEIEQNEHSIELHLPFIAYTMKGVNYTIVPLLIGDSNEKELGGFLGKYINSGAFFIISSDFTHWGSRFNYKGRCNNMNIDINNCIDNIDNDIIQLILEMNPIKFGGIIKGFDNTVCGRNAILVYLFMLNNLNIKPHLISYKRSNIIKNYNDSSVGYATIIFEYLSN